jgi:hypothetical protein
MADTDTAEILTERTVVEKHPEPHKHPVHDGARVDPDAPTAHSPAGHPAEKPEEPTGE